MKLRLILTLIMLTLASVILSACNGDVTEDSSQNSGTPTESTSTIATQDSSSSLPSVTLLTPEEAKAMMDKGGVTVVDVRRADEYATGHVPGAILLPNETIGETAESVLTDKKAAILIYCRSGRRSAEAASKLVALGYTKVYDFGGILSWPYDTETE